MKVSNFEDIVSRIHLQYSIYQTENIPEGYYLRHEEETRDNNKTWHVKFYYFAF